MHNSPAISYLCLVAKLICNLMAMLDTNYQSFFFKAVIFSDSSAGVNTPHSVIIAVMSSAGVTSKAGFQQCIPGKKSKTRHRESHMQNLNK